MAKTPDWYKDPNSTLDYSFDWSDWMTEGDTITAFEIFISPSNHTDPLIVNQTTSVGHVITTWLSQGRNNTKYNVTCRITTSGGRIEDATRTLGIKNS